MQTENFVTLGRSVGRSLKEREKCIKNIMDAAAAASAASTAAAAIGRRILRDFKTEQY